MEITKEDKNKIIDFILNTHRDKKSADVKFWEDQFVTITAGESYDLFFSIVPNRRCTVGCIGVGYAKDILEKIKKKEG